MIKYPFPVSSLFCLVLLCGACNTEFDAPKVTSGNADFSICIAVGGSQTAGFQDNGLSAAGQQNSYPALLHQQFMLTGADNPILLPTLTGDDGQYGVLPSPEYPTYPYKTIHSLVLSYRIICGTNTLSPVIGGANNNNNTAFFTTTIGSPTKHFNNLGVPGARSFHLSLQTFGLENMQLGGNPFYHRFASNPGNSTVLADAKSSNPTFFTLWIGLDDVLGYAMSGGEGSSSGLGAEDITPVDTFQNAIDRIVSSLKSNNSKGAIGNIPDITSLPFFTTIPYNGLVIASQSLADSLNTQYALYNASAMASGLPLIQFHTGNNAFVIEDNNPLYNQVGNIRQIKNGELLRLDIPSDSLKCGGWGSSNKIPASYVLDLTEVQNCKTAITSFNTILQNKAAAKGLAYIDFSAFYKTVESGILFNGVAFTTHFISGGFFSLDGINPNQRGYALCTNEWIKAINLKFGSNIPLVDANKYPGIKLP